MNAEICIHDNPHLLGESATHPTEPRYGTLAALLLLAGTEGRGSKPTRVGLDGPKARCLWHRAVPQRRRALPAHRIAARSGASNCRI
jgi:hypothetical protein